MVACRQPSTRSYNPRVDSRRGPFPATRSSLVRLAADPSAPGWRAAWERFFSDYWQPLYAYLRRTGSDSQEALDVLQDFFLLGLEGKLLGPYDAARGRLRTYLLTCLGNHRRKAWRRERARPDRAPVWLGGDAVGVVEPTAADPAEAFERDWNHRLFELAIEEIRSRLAETDPTDVRLLEEWVLSARRPAAADLAADLNLSRAALYTRATRLRRAISSEVERRLAFLQTHPETLTAERDAVLRALQERKT